MSASYTAHVPSSKYSLIVYPSSFWWDHVPTMASAAGVPLGSTAPVSLLPVQPPDEDRQQILDWEREMYGSEMEAGAQYEELGCTSQGLGEWPVADSGAVAGYYFTCASRWVSGTDESLNQFEWVVSEGPDGAVVAVRTSGAG